MIDHEHALKMAKMALLIDPDNRVAAAYLDMLKQLADAIRTLAPAQSGRGEPASPLLPGLERAVPVCACGDSFTSESLCINCVGPLLEDPIPGLERALEICESFSLDPVPAKRIRAEISRLNGEGSDHE